MVDLGIKPEELNRGAKNKKGTYKFFSSNINKSIDRIIIEKNKDDSYQVTIGKIAWDNNLFRSLRIPKISGWALNCIDSYCEDDSDILELKREVSNIDRIKSLNEHQLAKELVYIIFLNAICLLNKYVKDFEYEEYVNIVESWLSDEFQAGVVFPMFSDMELFFDRKRELHLMDGKCYEIEDIDNYYIAYDDLKPLLGEYENSISKCKDLEIAFGDEAVNLGSYQVNDAKRELSEKWMKALGISPLNKHSKETQKGDNTNVD